MARLKEKYREEIVPELMKEFGYSNVMEAPKLEKIVVNVGLGEAISNAKALESAVSDLTAITGQRPVVTRAKKSIAAFKLRAGMPVGATVTLRGPRMYEFFDRLVAITLPRIRDFRGVSPNSFDGRGNYTLGLQEQIAFPEIDYDKIDKSRGLELSLVTSAKTDEEGATHLDRPGASRRHLNGQEVFDRQSGRSREISDSAGEPLPSLWAQPGIHAKVWALPDLLPRVGVGWAPPRRDEVELVAVRSDKDPMEYETVRRADG